MSIGISTNTKPNIGVDSAVLEATSESRGTLSPRLVQLLSSAPPSSLQLALAPQNSSVAESSLDTAEQTIPTGIPYNAHPPGEPMKKNVITPHNSTLGKNKAISQPSHQDNALPITSAPQPPTAYNNSSSTNNNSNSNPSKPSNDPQ